MNRPLMIELVRTLRAIPAGNLDRLLAAHEVDRSGHCPRCRTVGCTIYAAARSALHGPR